MALKKSKGNMYDWVTHTHSHLAGECPHKCSYCYVQRNRFGVSPRYKGESRLIETELDVDYGSGKTIFIEHMNDMFAASIPVNWIYSILRHCNKYPNNCYVFQTKNLERAHWFLASFPPKFMMGTTIESNYIYRGTQAPPPEERYKGMLKFKGQKTFVTIEPIMDFDRVLSSWIISIKPSFVNIGADSKGCGLVEPSPEKILRLIEKLNENEITIRRKTNLKRLFLPPSQ